MSKLKGVVLIDGVHKPDNTIDGIKKLIKEFDFVPLKLVWLGGTEKMKSPSTFNEEFFKEFGVEVIMEGDPDDGISDPVSGIKKALKERDIDLVIQLSGSPQVNRDIMNRYASIVVSYGAKYIAGGTVFAEKTGKSQAIKPSIGLYATDKRVGKTAFGVYISKLMSGLGGYNTPWEAIVMTHSRGGPPSPPVVNIFNKHSLKPPEELTLEDLYNSRFKPEYLERLLSFKLHGASDVYEDALILSHYMDIYEEKTGKSAPKISVIGCRRAGAGYFHEFVVSNVELGLKASEICPGNYILHEGSGGEHPPTRVDATITLVQSDINISLLKEFPGLDGTECIILAHCQYETATVETIEQVEKALKERNPSLPVIRTYFEPEIIGDVNNVRKEVEGKKIMYLGTAPKKVKDKLLYSLEKNYGCNVVASSFDLARDDLMRYDIDEAMKEEKPEIFLIEIKARGVEGAKYIREKYGSPCKYLNNIPVEVDKEGNQIKGNVNLDETILEALNRGVVRFNKRTEKNFPVL
ncbi:MAG TPA: hypothetical protein PL110_00075 [Candidatus Eremiobacteraeota bacterium]|nr:MAG: Cyclic 2,3-diphosphoglycerate synthetase [bacterium ADurb.Bin363]HPZ06481.1 hypothetical protein [Candidatus Eremiobacteraeota bacterium]